jgi:LPS O-antigen subunit length determinant protein (WzzB/FepE family)
MTDSKKLLDTATPDQRQRRKNRAVLLILLALIGLIYAVTLVKMQAQGG